VTTAAPPRRIARAITRRHDENFPVAFLLLPRDLRADMQAIYAFCRGVDDIGDEASASTTAPERLAALDAFEIDLHRCWDGDPHDPRLQALAETIRRHRMDPDPFLRLIEANRLDQRQSRWETFGDLIRYCNHSATPVGRLVLEVLGQPSASRIGLSDHTCIGLQLVNFWQDIRRDLDERDRIYLPAEDMARFGVAEADLREPRANDRVRKLVAFEVARARAELVAGAPLWRLVPWRARLDIRMFSAGGLALCNAIARQDYDTLSHRPAPGRIGRARIALDVLLGTLRRRAR
jgi:squalene synthase HpnC